MAEPREFYYPLQDEAKDIDKVVHDLVEVTNDEGSVDNFVKVIDIDGEPHLSYGPVEAKQTIDVDVNEIPVGDGNDWVKASGFATTKSDGIAKDIIDNMDVWLYAPEKEPIISKFYFQLYNDVTYYNGGHGTSFYIEGRFSNIKVDDNDLYDPFTLNNISSLITNLFRNPNSNQCIFTFNGNDDFTFAEEIRLNKDQENINYSADKTPKYVALQIRSKAYPSPPVPAGMVLFSFDSQRIIIYRRQSEEVPSKFKFQFFRRNYNKIVFEQVYNFDTNESVIRTIENNNLIIDMNKTICLEATIGFREAAGSLFFGFKADKTIDDIGPCTGGIMLKGRPTMHIEDESYIHYRNNSLSLINGGAIIIENGSQQREEEKYTGPDNTEYIGSGPSFTFKDDSVFDYHYNINNYPKMHIYQQGFVSVGGKAGLNMDEGAGISAHGLALLNILDFSTIYINGAPKICIHGCDNAGYVSGSFTLHGAESDHTMTYIIKHYSLNLVNELKRLKVRDLAYSTLNTCATQIPENCQIIRNGLTQDEYANAYLSNIEDFVDTTRANGSECSNLPAAFLEGRTKFSVFESRSLPEFGNRQPTIYINGGPNIYFNSNTEESKSDPCFIMNDASTIIMNNNGDTIKKKQGYGPLIVANEQQFLFSGYGSRGAYSHGAYINEVGSHLSADYLVRDQQLEKIMAEALYLGDKCYNTEANLNKMNDVYQTMLTEWPGYTQSDFYTVNENSIIFGDKFKRSIPEFLKLKYDESPEATFAFQEGIAIIGGETGSHTWIKIGGDVGHYTQIHILDNSHIETKNNSSVCIRGYGTEPSWNNLPVNYGGSRCHILDNSTFVMRGTWLDPSISPEILHPQSQGGPVFEMTAQSDFRMWDHAHLKMALGANLEMTDGAHLEMNGNGLIDISSNNGIEITNDSNPSQDTTPISISIAPPRSGETEGLVTMSDGTQTIQFTLSQLATALNIQPVGNNLF